MVIRLCAAILVAIAAGGAAAQNVSSPLTREMGIDQKLGAQLPLDTPFKDEKGADRRLGYFMGERPLVLVPLFYNCQTGCSLIANNLIKSLAKANRSGSLVVGRDFDVLMLGIHPKETPDLALGRKSEMMTLLGDRNAGRNWHMLTGSYENIRRVTDAIGFKYKYDAARNLINHPTCTVIITPQGKVSGYTIGSEVPTKILERNVEIAARNEVGQRADQSWMFGCIMRDPNTGRYTLVVQNVMRLAGVLTVIILAGAIIRMGLKYRKDVLPKGGQLGRP